MKVVNLLINKIRKYKLIVTNTFEGHQPILSKHTIYNKIRARIGVNQKINVYISCSNGCSFEMNWEGTTIEYVKKYYEKWNKKYHKDMNCIHNYIIVESN